MTYTSTEMRNMIEGGIIVIQTLGPNIGLTSQEVYNIGERIRTTTPQLVSHCSKEAGSDPLRVAFLAFVAEFRPTFVWYKPWRFRRYRTIMERYTRLWAKRDSKIGIATPIKVAA